MESEYIKGNIVDIQADAIVLPANEKLKEGTGTSKAIFEAAGRKNLTKACKELRFCKTGNAVPTRAFNLNANYIIHAVVPKWIDGSHNEYNLLTSSYLSALNIADVMECESIAFPLLASGNNGFDKELAIRIAKESITSFTSKHLKKVYIVIFGDTMEVFMRGLGYTVVNDSNFINKKKLEHKNKQKQLIKQGKDIALRFVENQIQKGLDWINEPDNQQKIFEIGKQIYNFIIENKNN